MLELSKVSTYYNFIQALKSISIIVYEGEIVTVIGPNGAGKTTLLRTISGLNRARSGRIRLFGQDITHAESHVIVRMGVMHVLQGHQVFEDMTVLQNLRLGAYHRAKRLNKKDLWKDLEDIFIYFPILKERLRQKSGTLSGGEQVMLVIGRALMAKPYLLLLDEPSLGLAPKIVEIVFEALQKLNKRNITILLVEQNTELAFNLAKRCYLMELGQIALQGSIEEIKKSEKIIDLYLGKL